MKGEPCPLYRAELLSGGVKGPEPCLTWVQLTGSLLGGGTLPLTGAPREQLGYTSSRLFWKRPNERSMV